MLRDFFSLLNITAVNRARRGKLCVPSSETNQSKDNFFLDSFTLEMGQIGCPETSVNYKLMRCNIPEERNSRKHRGGSLKRRISRMFRLIEHVARR